MGKIVVLLVLSLIALAATPAVAHEARETSQPATAPATQPQSTGPLPTIALAIGSEEGKAMLTARVQFNGKPLEGAKVGFFVQRTFGLLPIGEDDTLEDGTAAVPFPSDLPGGSTGKLNVIARIKAPEKYAAACVEAAMAGGVVVPVQDDPFPPALWAPHAPPALVLAIVTLLCIVWSTFTFVILQLRKIRKELPRETPH